MQQLKIYFLLRWIWIEFEAKLSVANRDRGFEVYGSVMQRFNDQIN